MTEPTKPKTKSALVHDLLDAKGGATLATICKATGWKEHSARAALSEMRKAGSEIERIAGTKDGAPTRYRLVRQGEVSA
ncbi:MAG: DUF3489 domain-containing protein [Paracoccaceae bacterium]